MLTGNAGRVNDVAVLPDGQTLAIGVMGGSVKLWDRAASRSGPGLMATRRRGGRGPIEGGCRSGPKL